MNSLGKQAVSGPLFRSDFLVEGENLLVQGRISQAIFWKAAVVFLLGLFLLYPAFNLGIFIIFVAVLMGAVAALTRRFLLLILTDKRVMIRAGIAFVEVIQLRFSQIESVELSYTILGQLFGYASVILSGTGQRRMMIPFIANGVEFRKALEEKLLARDERSES